MYNNNTKFNLKNSIYLLLFFVILSCGGKQENFDTIINSNDLEKIRAKKIALDEEQNQIGNQLKQLEQKIKELDPLEKIPLVTTLQIKDTVFNHYLEIQGDVQTKQNLILYPEFSGTLSRVYVTEGQKVIAGQSLAKIDDGGLSQQLAQLEIQASLAKTTFERQERLWNQNIGSEIQYLQSKSAYETQQKAINQLKQQIGKTIIKAPFSGTIDEIITEQGSVVIPGQSQILRIVNLDNMYIETNVPESYLTHVTQGKKVTVEIPVLNTQFDTQVRQVGDFINPANRTFKLEVAVPKTQKNIKPNLTAKLKINDYTNEKALLIPLNIISENAEGEQYIFVVSNNNGETAKAKKTIIQTGKSQGDLIEVISGINSGDQIIQEGARSVKDGQEVKILTY